MKELLLTVILAGGLSMTAQAQTWTAKTPPPAPIGPGVSAVLEGGFSYVFTGGGTPFFRYDPVADTWTTLLDLPEAAWAGAAVVSPADGVNLFGVPGGGSTGFYKYSIPGDTWVSLPGVLNPVSNGGGALYSSGSIYAWSGGSTFHFQAYDVAGGFWTLRAPCPTAEVPGTSGCVLVSGPILLISSASQLYSISSNTWSPAPSPPEFPASGSSLERNSGGTPYYFPGGLSTNLYQGDTTGTTWTLLTNPAVVSSPGRWIITPTAFSLLNPGGLFEATSVPPPPPPPPPAPATCCPNGTHADFGGCSSGGATGNFLGVMLGLAALFYVRFRKAVS